MKVTRKGNNKDLKKFCIYIWQERKTNGVDTYIDYIGDEELYYELRLDILKKEYEKLIHNFKK